ncbi:hypothetical protein NT239_09800 [Chitinibacter sp. SCUT-21]|uniref:hypothetical protein n=1 Tax=Chitinibacter sp. SCUT-21 TaxID=2970891 RepID=UPI0035A5D536
MKYVKLSCQFLLLLTTIIWFFYLINIDKKLSIYISNNYTYWVLFYAILLAGSLYDTCKDISQWAKASISESLQKKKVIRILKILKPSDKLILSKFILEQSNEYFFNPKDTSIDWLTACKLMYPTGTIRQDQKHGYRLSVWAQDYLSRNPNLLY